MKNKSLQKLIAVLLAALMVVVGVPFTALAEGEGAVLVTFAPGTDDTAGDTVTSSYETDAVLTLPECSFTREGFEFAGWYDGSAQYLAGTEYTATADVTFTPVWNNTIASHGYYSADGKIDSNGDGIIDIVNGTVASNQLVGSLGNNGVNAVMNLYSGTFTDITCMASGSSATVACNSVYNIYGGTITGNVFGVSRCPANNGTVHTLTGHNTYNIYGGTFANENENWGRCLTTSWLAGSVLNGTVTFNISGGTIEESSVIGFGGTQRTSSAVINGAHNIIINNKEIVENNGSLKGVSIGVKGNVYSTLEADYLIVVMNNNEYANRTGAEISSESIATHTLYVNEGKATPKFNAENALIGFEIVSDKSGVVPAVNGQPLNKNAYGYYDIALGITNISFIECCTASFESNTADTIGETADVAFLAGVPFALPECSFTREGFTFAGWYDGTDIYAAGAEYTATADVTFTPVWTNAVAMSFYYSADGTIDTNGDGIIDVVGATVTPSLLGSGAATGATATMNIYSGTVDELTCMASGNSATATCNSVYNIYGGTIGHIFGVSRYTGGNTAVVHTLNGNNTYNLYGGNYTGVIAQSYKMGSVINGILTYNINGGTFTEGNYFVFGGTQWSPKVEINGAANFIINNKEIAENGGTLAGIEIGKKGNILTKYGNLIIVMNNNEYANRTGAEISSESIATHTLYVNEGKATPKFNAENALIGFEIVSDKAGLIPAVNGLPLAMNENGYYNIEAGTSSITFVDDVDYVTNGSYIEFYKDFELDITTVAHNEIDGKFFMGWTFEDGTAPEGTNFKLGDKLYARYVDFSLNEDFYIEGAQIRLKVSSKDLGEAVRFIIRRTDATDALNIKGYGAVVAPSLAVGKDDLVIGGVYTYGEREYDAIKVPALKIYAEYEGYEQYTVCVTKIGKANYAQLYAVRGYIEYTDYNGKDHVLYSDYYATNLVNVAQAILDDENVVDEAARARCEAIVATEKKRVKDKYNNLEKLPLSNNYKDAELVAEVSLDEIYQLGEGGVSVREILIETGDTEEEAVEIFQITDLHFNYVNKQDFAEANPSIMASYNGRQWLKDGASVPNAIQALEYASQGDAVVITGDVIDFMSHGAVELTRKYIWDPYPNTLITFGNHDFERRCQDTPLTPDPTSYQSRYDFLQSNWNHNVYYASKIIKDKVMLIQLENGTTKFWNSQIQPLTNDLALAREKGYTVLIFYHIPLCTNNPEEKNLYPVRRNDTYTHNFCDNGVGYPGTTDSATVAVYDIITNNADIIDGTFCGHFHSDYKTEIIAKNADGTDAVIPQYVLTGNPYDGGHVLKITVK